MRGRRVLHSVGAVLGHGTGFWRVLDVAERFSRFRENQLPVLAYHRVADPDSPAGLYPGLVSATPGEFESQMAFLAEARHVVSLEELLAVRDGGARLPPRSVMVTVDDAYRDVADVIWPTMRRLGLPMTLFVPTAFPDDPGAEFWWDRLYDAVSHAESGTLETPIGPVEIGMDPRAAFNTLRDRLKGVAHERALAVVDEIAGCSGAPERPAAVLGWQELRQLGCEGMGVAAHSRTHPLLTRVSPEEAYAEIAGSLTDLRRKLGSAPPVLAYPSGAFNDQVVGLVERAGYRIAFGLAKWGGNDLRRPSWLRLRRILVTSRVTLPLLRAQLLPVLSRYEGIGSSRWS